MPNCTICGQPIDKLPNWLDDVEIAFRCAVCAENTSHALPGPDDDVDEAAPAAVKDDDKEEEEDDDDDEDEEEKDD